MKTEYSAKDKIFTLSKYSVLRLLHKKNFTNKRIHGINYNFICHYLKDKLSNKMDKTNADWERQVNFWRKGI